MDYSILTTRCKFQRSDVCPRINITASGYKYTTDMFSSGEDRREKKCPAFLSRTSNIFRITLYQEGQDTKLVGNSVESWCNRQIQTFQSETC